VIALETTIGRLLGANGQQFAGVDNSIKRLNANQQRLITAADNHDAQFACIMRAMFLRFENTIGRINDLIQKTLGDDEAAELISEMSYAWMNNVFIEFEAFRKLPDYREHLNQWYMGIPLGQLLAEGEDRAKVLEERTKAALAARAKEREELQKLAEGEAAAKEEGGEPEEGDEPTEEGDAPESDGEKHPEGATFFGGEEDGGSNDVADEADGSEEPVEAQAEPDAVPEVQDEDGPVPGPEAEREDQPEVP
jgi:hypothetical protein